MNKDNYKNAINQIHPSDELKEKTIRKMKQSKQNKISYIKILSSVAVVLIVFSIGMFEFKNYKSDEANINNPINVATIKNDLPRFKDMEELKEALKESSGDYRKSIMFSDVALATNELAQTESATENKNMDTVSDLGTGKLDYSKTNVQVENVDEADIVKTDGDYIYYVTRNNVFIVNAKELKTISSLQIKEDKKQFNPSEIFINDDKLIVLGNYYEYEEVVTKEGDITPDIAYEEDFIERATPAYTNTARITSINTAKAIVYDISNKENPKIIREVGLDGYYMNSRMIGDNIFFVSRKSSYYYDGIKDDEILPRVQDSIAQQKTRNIECTDIAYFRGTDEHSYMLVGGFNINNNNEMSVETFFGASQDVYASENNLYLAQTVYDDNWYANTTIYRFALINSQIVLQAKGEVEGYLNNQFSMDEYEGNLRLATTYTIREGNEEIVGDADGVPVVSSSETKYSNRLYVLDKDLNEIGRIDDLAKDEKIYSVRFIGKMGYIVTFEQVDPLFVIDLSNPKKPEIKGELKIPGYSSYLHPYDENHIIGIGYNTKSNGHGGITTDTMKMSMFDVSDVENPKEMFSIDIGNQYVYSEILYNHKSLFYKKSENLIGFPVSYDGQGRFEIFKIDLKNGFEKCAEILNNKGYYGIERAIYINDVLYTLHYNRIISYDLNTFEKINELELMSEDNNDDLIVAY